MADLTDVGDGFQITEAIPLVDGSTQTTLVDQTGSPVGTITVRSDGTAQANLPQVQTSGGSFDFSNVLSRVTGILDSAAKTAQGVANEATRISRGIQGGAQGAQLGYNAPINLKPWVVGGIAIAVGVAIAASAASSSRRR